LDTTLLGLPVRPNISTRLIKSSKGIEVYHKRPLAKDFNSAQKPGTISQSMQASDVGSELHVPEINQGQHAPIKTLKELQD